MRGPRQEVIEKRPLYVLIGFYGRENQASVAATTPDKYQKDTMGTADQSPTPEQYPWCGGPGVASGLQSPLCTTARSKRT